MKRIGYIVWYADMDKLDLNDPWLKKWWIQQILTHGRFEDISRLDFNEVRKNMASLRLTHNIKSLWEDYFKVKWES